MNLVRSEDNYALLSHRYLWRKHHLYLRDMSTGFWFRDKILSEGVKCIGRNQKLDELFALHLSELMIEKYSTLGSVH